MMKLSATQKEIIGLMREGYVITWNLGVTTSAYYTLKNSNNHRYINGNTFKSLKDKGIIEPDKNDNYGFRVREYQLTELGKTIQL